jgi:preprotein translocase subunit SecB
MSTESPLHDPDQSGPRFGIQRIYVKDVSYEAPATPEAFTQQVAPQIGMQVGTKSTPLEREFYEVVLSATVSAKQNDKTAFLVEVQQAGIFAIQGYDEQQLGALLNTYCPNILFPFLREVVADLTTKGGFAPLLLAPINFEALYAQRQQQTRRADGPEATSH